MKTAILIFFLSSPAFGQQVLTTAKLSSCNASTCTRLVSDEIHRSTLSPNIMAFADATLEIFKSEENGKKLQSFKAGDGYVDLDEQVVVLRDLKGSKHKELIYNLETSSISFY